MVFLCILRCFILLWNMQKIKIFLKNMWLGAIIAAIVFAAVYIFFWYYDSQWSFLGWLIDKLWYLAILFISIVLIYSFWKTNKKWSQWGLVVILIVNFVLGSWFFVEKNLELSVVQISILLAVILLSFLFSMIKYWVKYILISVTILVGVGLLLFSFLPLYEEGPDRVWFIASQESTLYLAWELENRSNTYIQSDVTTTKKIFEKTPTNGRYSLDLKGKNRLSFVSPQSNVDIAAFLELPDGNQLVILPQSAMMIQEENITGWLVYNIEVLQGQVLFLTSPQIQNNVMFDTGVLAVQLVVNEEFRVQVWQNFDKQTFLEEVPERIIKNHDQLLQKYLLRQREFFIEQIGKNSLMVPSLRQLNHYYLDILFSIDSEKFGNNILNFQAFQKELEGMLPESMTANFEYDQEIADENIKNWIDKAWSQTMYFKWKGE